jgi:hypothetical protein
MRPPNWRSDAWAPNRPRLIGLFDRKNGKSSKRNLAEKQGRDRASRRQPERQRDRTRSRTDRWEYCRPTFSESYRDWPMVDGAAGTHPSEAANAAAASRVPGSALKPQRQPVVLLAFELSPSADARGADPKPLARPPVAQPLRDRGQLANSKIQRQSSRSAPGAVRIPPRSGYVDSKLLREPCFSLAPSATKPPFCSNKPKRPLLFSALLRSRLRRVRQIQF